MRKHTFTKFLNEPIGIKDIIFFSALLIAFVIWFACRPAWLLLFLGTGFVTVIVRTVAIIARLAEDYKGKRANKADEKKLDKEIRNNLYFISAKAFAQRLILDNIRNTFDNANASMDIIPAREFEKFLNGEEIEVKIYGVIQCESAVVFREMLGEISIIYADVPQRAIRPIIDYLTQLKSAGKHETVLHPDNSFFPFATAETRKQLIGLLRNELDSCNVVEKDEDILITI